MAKGKNVTFCASKFIRLVGLVALGTVAVSCAESARVEPASSGCSSSSALVADDTGKKNDGTKAVTFYGDLLPILSSNVADHSYKCTTCHAHYAKPKGLNNVEEVERVVESMRSGRMPRGGDPVPAEMIELFTMWRIQGFQEGSPKSSTTIPGQTDPKASKTSTSSNCP